MNSVRKTTATILFGFVPCVVMVVFLSQVAWGKVPPAPTRAELTEALVQKNWTLLDDDQVAVRNQAQQILSKGGLETARFIAENHPQASYEVRMRGVQIFKEIMLESLQNQEADLTAALEELMQQMRLQDEELAGPEFDDFEIVHQVLLDSVSYRRLIRLKAGVEFREMTRGVPGITNARFTVSVPNNIFLGKDFEGTEEDLPHLLRALRLGESSFGESRGLFHIGDCPIPLQALQDLGAGMPGVTIDHRGPARIGISTRRQAFGNDDTDWAIDTVQPGTSARYAGLQSNDRIVRINGKNVGSFDSFTTALEDYKPGDVVTLDVLRNFAEPKDLILTLDENGKIGMEVDKDFERFTLIKSVEPESVAGKAELSNQYRIDRVDGRTVDADGVDYYSLYMSQKMPGDRVLITVRKFEQVELELRAWVGTYR
ncbi:MAG: PDZ domain-containing protein [Planctomycetaceae bacterium]|nr:PDZ domain-containing protein [Planctomycetaceae bacterium]